MMPISKHRDELNGKCSWCGKPAKLTRMQEPPLDVKESDFVIYREACSKHLGILFLWARLNRE